MQRLLTLKRLGSVYGLMEELHSLEARVAAAEVGEVEGAIRTEASRLRAVWAKERVAIQEEELPGRSVIAVREELTARKNRQFVPILDMRREIRELAQFRHKDSRLWSERMKSLLDAELERGRTLEERRRQAASDDRFLAQKRRGKNADRGHPDR